MKISGPYPTMYNRDEIFFRLGIEQSEELLQKILTFKMILGFHIFIEPVKPII